MTTPTQAPGAPKITIKIKNNYGQEVAYPVCEQAKLFAHLTNTKTLTREALQIIKALGYSIEVQRDQFNF
jgi:hypothetical protein